jgi:hypothetical protein
VNIMKDEKLQKSVFGDIYTPYLNIRSYTRHDCDTPHVRSAHYCTYHISKLVNANTITFMGWLFQCE